ncbi:986_t:CDS:2, partial [Entrophospora sp. SA101]
EELIAGEENKVSNSNTKPNLSNSRDTQRSERKKSNGNNETAPNVKIVSLDSLFSKTKATPHLYYKPVSSEDAQSRLKVMERRRNRGHS